MTAWTETLDPDLRDRVRALSSRECRFVWRNRESGEVFPDPPAGQTCWWEAWHSDTLLTFSGPYIGPVSGATLNALVLMFLPNLEAVIGIRETSRF